MKELKSLFYPKSICIVGSSRINTSFSIVRPSVFKRIVKNVQMSFKNVTVIDIEEEDIPEISSDLTIILLPPKHTLEFFPKIFCKALIILSGNFNSEEKEYMLKLARKRKFRILGPNSVCGLVNSDNGLNTTFEKNLNVRRGNFSIICQSGGVGASLLDLSISNFTGINKLIWLGDAWDIDFSDLVKYLSSDQQTKSIGMYIEGIKDGARFIQTIKNTKKPVVSLKGGISEAGTKRALSHTSSLSGSSRIYSGVFKQTGIIEVESIEELYETTLSLSKSKRMRGDNIAIVSNMGGPAILAADYAHKFDLKIPEFSKRTVNAIKKKYPIHAINPLDLVADADGKRYEFCLKQVLKDKNIDAILIINMLKSCTLKSAETEIIAKIIKKSEKPIIDCVPALDDWDKIRRVMNPEGVYVFNNLERSVKILRALYDYNMFRRRR